MEFLQPIWLWALCGLLVPLGIHLLSRKAGKTIPIGSLRFLRESPTAKFKRFRFNEIALLFLRCLLLILMTFLLARAGSTWFQPPLQKWVVLEQGVTRSLQIGPVIESLENQGFEIRLMASGFPLASNGTFDEPIDDYWSVVSRLVSHSLDSIVVISFNYQRKFKGERIAMPPNMKWLVTDEAEKKLVAQAVLADNDSVWVREGKSSARVTTFETSKAPALSLPDSLPVSPPGEISILIVSAPDFAYDEKILVAALKAIQSITPHRIRITKKNINQAVDSAQHAIFWLANDAPHSASAPVTIAYRNCKHESLPLLMPAVEAVNECGEFRNVRWVITKRLNEETALKENLTLRLAGLILPAKAVDEYDQRVLPESMMWASGKTNQSESVDQKQKGNMDFLITTLLLLTLIAERTLAFKRNQ